MRKFIKILLAIIAAILTIMFSTVTVAEETDQPKQKTYTVKLYLQEVEQEEKELALKQCNMIPKKLLLILAKDGWTITIGDEKFNEVVKSGILDNKDIDKETVAGLAINSQKAIYIKNGMVDTAITHEIGHAIDFSFGLSKNVEFCRIYEKEKENFECFAGIANLEHCTKSEAEYFAEAFHQYILANEQLKEACPDTYNYIKTFIDAL